MNPLAPIPAVIGAVCGISVYPFATAVISQWSRWKQRVKEEARLKNTTFILSGTLSEKRLRNNLKALAKDGRNGVLHIFTGRRKGYVLFRNGQIIDAFYRNGYGCEAVSKLLLVEDGDYFFEPRAIYQPNLVRKTVELLLQK